LQYIEPNVEGHLRHWAVLDYEPKLQLNMFESELLRHMKQGILHSYIAWDIKLH
jgi:hypothetical protein